MFRSVKHCLRIVASASQKASEESESSDRKDEHAQSDEENVSVGKALRLLQKIRACIVSCEIVPDGIATPASKIFSQATLGLLIQEKLTDFM